MGRFPVELTHEDLIAYFTLSSADLAQLPITSAPQNRLGFALQLGALRYLGFFPDDLDVAPVAVVSYIADQVGAVPEDLRAYGTREQTRTEHAQQVQAYLGYQKTTPKDLRDLHAWLVERALEHDRPTLLLQLACEHLRSAFKVRPGLTPLERLVASARQRAWKETSQLLSLLLTEERRTVLDQVLVVDPTRGRTPLAWFRQNAARSSPRSIREALDKLGVLKEWRVETWNLEVLTPNRRKLLAQLGGKSTAQSLQRMEEMRRYPILLAFLHQSLREITDEAVDLFDRCLGDAYHHAERELNEYRLSIARSANEKVHLLHELAGIVLDPAIGNSQVRKRIYQRISPDALRAVVEECGEIMRPKEDSYLDLLAERYGYLRQFTPRLLDTLTFRSNRRDDPLISAIEVLRAMNREGRRKIPAGTPLEFVETNRLPYVVSEDGRINHAYYELCVLWELRSSLRAGDLWLETSRRYANPETYLIPPDRWPSLRSEACNNLGAPQDGTERLAERQKELGELLARMDRSLPPHGDDVRIENGALVVSSLEGEERSASLVALGAEIDARLPLIEFSNLLMEVDSWTGFSTHFEHAGGSEPRTQDLLVHCYAGVLAQACNFGLTRMAQMSDLSYRELAWCTTWFLREETLQHSNTRVVNFQYRQPLARLWGGGTLSSSDGQRFPAAVRSQTARPLPKYYGFGSGLTFYSWSSDQFSQYGSKPTFSTLRDATVVLDGILDNETELPIVEHTTDTAGYTDLIFGLFDLLGLQFSPRLRDIGNQKLYRLDRTIRYQRLEPFLRGRIKPALFLQHWDDLLRVAASMKSGWVTASLFIGKLQSFRRQNVLTTALQEYGRLQKTIFILRWLDDENYRRRIGVQLNKGEALHALRRFLFLANEGKIRKRYREEQLNQAACLNLVTNAVVVWNTVYMNEVIKQLRAEGYPIDDADVAHLSPARYEHINPYGKYPFNIDEAQRQGRLRPLRNQ